MTGRSRAPEFLSARLGFGRHDRAWDLARPDAPVIVTGPNGSGKTTMVEGILRTIFGFRRRAQADRLLLEARRPWDGRPFRASVVVRTAAGPVLEWSRAFDSDEVEVREVGGEMRFRGIAKPASTSTSDAAYWDLVEQTFGVTDLDDYARTAWVGQGRALEARFDAELLRLVDGGHARVGEALEQVRRAHRDLTRTPVADGERRSGRDGVLEEAESELHSVRASLGEARVAADDLATHRDRLATVEDRILALETETAALERQRLELLERRRIQAEYAEARQRLDRIVEARSELAESRREVDVSEQESERLGRTSDYPADFVRRTHELQAIWDEGLRLAPASSPEAQAVGEHAGARWRDLLPPLAGIALVAGGAGGVQAGERFGWFLAAAGVALVLRAMFTAIERRALAREASVRREADRTRRDELRRRESRLREGIPDAADLTSANVEGRRAAFERSQAAEVRLDLARRAHREAARRVDALGDLLGAPGRSWELLEADAERTVREKERELAGLPAGSGSTSETVAPGDLPARLSRLGNELDELRDERDGLLVAIDRATTAAAALPRLEREASESARRVGEARESARVHRAAFCLLRDGYAEYREQDEGRLAASVARQLERLSAGGLERFVALEGLRSATVEVDGRAVELDSPHLSHGQKHIVMLAVRIGAADFLASAGPAAPLIIDEPFAHLDDEHAALVVRLLSSVAEERQVIVTTQDEALLERLGLEASVRLGEAAVSRRARPVRPDTEGVEETEPLNAGEATRV